MKNIIIIISILHVITARSLDGSVGDVFRRNSSVNQTNKASKQEESDLKNSKATATINAVYNQNGSHHEVFNTSNPHFENLNFNLNKSTHLVNVTVTPTSNLTANITNKERELLERGGEDLEIHLVYQTPIVNLTDGGVSQNKTNTSLVDDYIGMHAIITLQGPGFSREHLQSISAPKTADPTKAI